MLNLLSCRISFPTCTLHINEPVVIVDGELGPVAPAIPAGHAASHSHQNSKEKLLVSAVCTFCNFFMLLHYFGSGAPHSFPMPFLLHTYKHTIANTKKTRNCNFRNTVTDLPCTPGQPEKILALGSNAEEIGKDNLEGPNQQQKHTACVDRQVVGITVSALPCTTGLPEKI